MDLKKINESLRQLRKIFNEAEKLKKTEKDLSTKQINDLPDSDFVFVGKTGNKSDRRFPIPDIAHARNALARAAEIGGATEKQVRAAITKKFPSLSKQGQKIGETDNEEKKEESFNIKDENKKMNIKKLNESLGQLKQSLSEEVNSKEMIKELDKMLKFIHAKIFANLSNDGHKKEAKKASDIIKAMSDLKSDILRL